MQSAIIFIALISLVSAETLIFEDDFKTFNLKRWQHEITMTGGGNWEFQWYVNNRTNSYVRDSILYLKTSLTNDVIGDDKMTHGFMDIWGTTPAD